MSMPRPVRYPFSRALTVARNGAGGMVLEVLKSARLAIGRAPGTVILSPWTASGLRGATAISRAPSGAGTPVCRRRSTGGLDRTADACSAT